MNVDWEKLQNEGKLDNQNIQSLIDEVKKEFAEQKMKKCLEKNEEIKKQLPTGEKTIIQQLALEQLDEDEINNKLASTKQEQSEKKTNQTSSDQKDDDNIKKCQNCKRSDIKVNSCAGCQEVYYCTVDCQKVDWKNHKKQCQEKQEQIKELQRLEERKKKKSIDWFTHIGNCGQGNFSVIHQMKENSTGKVYAIKVVERKRLRQLGKEKDILMEKHALKKLCGSPYVIEFIDTFADELTLYIQMEYVNGGELWNYCRIFGLIGTSLVRYFLAKILVALEYIHSKGIVHRDIKTENILITQENKNVKFCDFGTCRDALDNSIQGAGTGRPGKRMFEHFVGTPNFMAPECVRNKASEYCSDIYSLGGVAFQLQTGFPPFLGKSEYLIFLQSEKQDPIFKDELWENQDDLKDLILKMMKKDMNERITISEIKKHPYFNNIDWNHLPSYEEALQEFTKQEKFFQNVKGNLVEKSEQLNEKVDKINETFKEWEDKLTQANEFTEEEKSKMLKRLQLMRLQANQMYNIEEFQWQNFEYKQQNSNSEENDDESDDDSDDEN